jgi:hypothetical protein
MDPNRSICKDVQTVTLDVPPPPGPAVFFTARHDAHLDPSTTPARPRQGRFSWFWGVSGGSILSVLGFLALTLYQQYNDSLTELRNDLKRFNITCGDLVKKDEMHNRMTHLYTKLKELGDNHADGKSHLMLVEHQLKVSEEERRELMHEVQRLRERLAAVEGRQSVAATPASADQH